MKVEIKQERYPIPPVMKSLKEAGFEWSAQKSAFIGEVTEQNQFMLQLLGVLDSKGKETMQKEQLKKPAYEQKSELLKNMIKEIGEKFEINPDTIAEALAFGENFYQYSLNNVVLIYHQNPYCQYVQSFQKWKEMGVSVKKGEHGMNILVPVEVTYLQVGEDKYIPLRIAPEELKEAYKNKQIESIKKLHFRAGTVFDISQTTFPKERYPELFHMGYSSEESHSIFEGLAEFCRKEIHCPVEIADLNSIRLRGAYHSEVHMIQLNEMLEDTEKLSTLSHETGHALIHHENRNGKSTEQKEFEADALSIMLHSHYGMEITESRKRHLSGVYKLMKEKEPEVKINECLNHVFQVYKNNIEKMDRYVNKSIQQAQENAIEPKRDSEKYNESIDPVSQLLQEAAAKRRCQYITFADEKER